MPETATIAVEAKNLDQADESRELEHGRIDFVNLPGATIGRATLQPGWKWSTDIKPMVGTDSCQAGHTGYLVSGRFHVRTDDGRDFEFGPGDAHVVEPGHDAWVVGDEPCVIIDFAATGMGASGRVGRCPCGVEFRVANDEQIDHLVDAIREHASASHGHEVTAEHVRGELSAT